MSVIGSLAAFDHWRQRVYLIESVPVLGLDGDALDAAYDAACVARRAGRRRPRPAAAVRAGRAARGRRASCPTVRSSMADGMYQQAVEVAKEHILAGDIFQVVLPSATTSSSTPTRSTSTACCARSTRARTCTSCAIPSITIVGASPEPMVQVLGRKVISRPIAGTRRRGRDRRARPADGRRAEGEPEGGRRAHHARRPRPQRRRPRRQVRHACTSTS